VPSEEGKILKPEQSRILRYEIDLLTKDGVRENLVDDEGLPWSTSLYSKAQQKQAEVLARPNVVEVRIFGMVLVMAAKK